MELELTLKNCKTLLSPVVLKAAEKLLVRECDEIEKGTYIAYIDKGKDTYDVSLTLVSDKVKEHRCDCSNSDKFCEHRSALLLHLADNKKNRQPKLKAAKKKREIDALLENIEADELKLWLKNLLEKNKDIAFSFTNHFKTGTQKITPQESIIITNDVCKAVAKNKKKIDQTQLKKIIELWSEAHSGIMKQYLDDVSDQESFLCLHNVISACIAYDAAIDISSTRIYSYVFDLLAQTRQTITELQNDESWQHAVGYFIQNIPEENKPIRIYYLKHVLALCEVSEEYRRAKLLDTVFVQYQAIFHDNIYNGREYTHLLFDSLKKYGLFEQYGSLFRPASFDNTYNQELITLLIKHKEYQLAEKYCREQIKNNFQDKYNIDYWQLLKLIYRTTGDQAKLLEIAKALLLYTFEFEDYEYVAANMPDGEEKKKWKSKILSKAKNTYENRKLARVLYFKILASEGKYKKMIESVNNSGNAVLLEYFDILAQADKQALLNALLSNREFYYDYGESEEEDFNEKIYQGLLRYFNAGELKAAIKPKGAVFFYSRHSFEDYLRKKLDALPA